jgi:tetratricopeptide (TPR) repeat protein
MRVLGLKTAVVEIHQAIMQGKRQNLPSPFFFMVGAGISQPPLPLAAEIQTSCQLEAQVYGKDKPPDKDSLIDTYSYWFEQAYPNAENRQLYLRSLMEKAFISRANFRLAHLMLENSVTNLVVTTNFDDFLSRALALFGRRHIVCDHTKTLARIDLRSSDVQIIHIHGSYWFYDCCNLQEEILNRAKGSSATSFTMLSTLDDILRAHSPLVVGYSGWEGDVFMDALRRRLSEPLRTNLYWFCHKRHDLERLPEWLKANPNVCAVVPEAPEPVVAPTAGKEGLARPNPSGEREEPVLKASHVFDELILRLKLESPQLTKDPLGFFAAQLRDSLLGENPDESENDVYAIRSVIDRLVRIRDQEQALPPPSREETALESFRNAIRQSDRREAIRLAEKIPTGALSPEQLGEVISALDDATSALSDNSEEQLKAYDLILAMANRLEALRGPELFTKKLVAKTLLSKAFTLGALGHSKEAIRACDETLERFDGGSDPAFQETIAKALGRKAYNLGNLELHAEAIGVWEEVVRRFGEAVEPGIREQVAKSLINKGVVLSRLNRGVEAVAAYDDMLARSSGAAEPAIRTEIARALYGKGFALNEVNRHVEAIAAYDELLLQFGDATEPALRKLIADGMLNKGASLNALGRVEEAVKVYSVLLSRFEDDTDPKLQLTVAKAMINSGDLLAFLQRKEEAISCYDNVMLRFGDATEPELRDQVSKAKAGKAVVS